MHPLEILTPLGQVEIWGLRVDGSSLRDPINRTTTKGRTEIDDELALCLWVESTPGFEVARPILVHVYSRFLPITTYRYQQPGETRLRAAIRHGQASEMLDGKSNLQLAQNLHDRFFDELIRRGKSQPFRVPRVYEEAV